MDLLKIAQRLPFAPPIFNDALLQKYSGKITRPSNISSIPSFAAKLQDASVGSLPQAIAHRGQSADYPENSLLAHEAAVKCGAHGLETDVRLSRDGVVVLTHDRSLKRCFGVDGFVGDYDWDFLSTLRTVREPCEPLARLQDLLELFREWPSTWLLLDIKIDDDPEQLIRQIANTFALVDIGTPWRDRAVLGYWTAPYIPLCQEYLPGFPMVNISFCVDYSRNFLTVPNASFSLIHASLVFPPGRSFVRDLRKQRESRRIYSWTVNDEKNMEWCIKQGIDGVITDSIPRFLEVCDAYREKNKKKNYPWTMKLYWGFARLNFWVYLWGVILRRKFGSCFRIIGEQKKDE